MKKIMMLLVLSASIGLVQAQKKKIESIKGTSVESSEGIEVDGVGNKQTYSLNGGKAEIAGADNTITINGHAGVLDVAGSGNTVFVDKVTKVIMAGSNNKVFYVSSPTKTGKPSVSMEGTGNSVRRK